MASSAFLTKMRPVHRIAGTIIMLFTLYIGSTGLWIQWTDLRAILSHAAATDPDMIAIRESINGTGNYEVIKPTDYAAPTLPDSYDFTSATGKVLSSARSAAADKPLTFLELRVVNGRPLGLAQAGNKTIRVDPATGTVLPNPPPGPRERPAPSMHGTAKKWHRMTIATGYWGNLLEMVNALIGIGLFVAIVTGLVMYFGLLKARHKAGLPAVFWSSGGTWRSLHRGVSIVAAVFLLIVSVSGALLAIDTVFLGVYGATHTHAGRFARFPPGMSADYSSPLTDAEVPKMLATTLSAYHAAEGTTPVKVLRLRYFSGMPQAVILTGGPKETRQLVYNAQTGKRASMTEPGYPNVGFPFGWEEHEYMKMIHRGDALGLPGRLLDVFAGLSLVFLSASGLYMYIDLVRRRRRGGRMQLFWT